MADAAPQGTAAGEGRRAHRAFEVQQEAIYIEISRGRASQLGISPEEVTRPLREQNIVVPSGAVDAASMRMAIQSDRGFSERRGFRESDHSPGRQEAKRSVRLRDVASMRRRYSVETAGHHACVTGKPAMTSGISTVSE